ncbi:hypothetical protein EVAR_74565_1 [Eumeta japonica]|uniref:Uncharacterized protein n=1 Tax=Eumeta variegata TaxID=151549 RepID=A0A4C1TEW0_EUMVA|nr:hypothetical protein EVAR_74565_1 [Eumeta japonica]
MKTELKQKEKLDIQIRYTDEYMDEGGQIKIILRFRTQRRIRYFPVVGEQGTTYPLLQQLIKDLRTTCPGVTGLPTGDTSFAEAIKLAGKVCGAQTGRCARPPAGLGETHETFVRESARVGRARVPRRARGAYRSERGACAGRGRRRRRHSAQSAVGRAASAQLAPPPTGDPRRAERRHGLRTPSRRTSSSPSVENYSYRHRVTRVIKRVAASLEKWRAVPAAAARAAERRSRRDRGPPVGRGGGLRSVEPEEDRSRKRTPLTFAHRSDKIYDKR